jgi:hypothetical protein
MHHFKYNGENIIDNDIEHGDWVLMSLTKNYHFNRAEFQEWCEEEHWDFLSQYGRQFVDEDGFNQKEIDWDYVDMDMEYSWLVEASVIGKVQHYKITHE